jgi:hypothetical protein
MARQPCRHMAGNGVTYFPIYFLNKKAAAPVFSSLLAFLITRITAILLMARSKRLILSGRDARFPNIRLISAHPQVKGKHGPIYVVEGTTDPVQCERQLESISRMTLPGTPGEARDQGS